MRSLPSQGSPCAPIAHRLIPLFMLIAFAFSACDAPATPSATPEGLTPATSTEDAARETMGVETVHTAIELPLLTIPTICVPTCVVGACVDDTCDGVDDDCDGRVDEDYVPQPTRCGLGECTSNGTRICAKGVLVDTCEAGTPIIDLNLCDGVDDDCDGEFNAPVACDDGVACTADSCNPITGACTYDDSACVLTVASCMAPGKDGAATRCGQYDPDWTCQCDTMCDEGAYGDCCEDYAPLCAEPCGSNPCANEGTCALCDPACTPDAAPTCYAEACPDVTAACDGDTGCGLARRCIDRCNTDADCIVGCLEGLEGDAFTLAKAYTRCGVIHCSWIPQRCGSDTCVQDRYYCDCPTGWEGEHCEIPSPCGGCENGGLCTPSGCACMPGFMGDHCEDTLSTCWPGSCEADETCIAASGERNLCVCAEGSRPDCQGDCRPVDAIGDGTCDPHFSCSATAFDGGDCCPSGTILDCEGSCQALSRLGDGQCDAFFACEAFGRDHADCRDLGETCGNADARCASGICGDHYDQIGVCVACEVDSDCRVDQVCQIDTTPGLGSAASCVDDWHNVWTGGSCNADGWQEDACLVGTCQSSPGDALGTCFACLDHSDCGDGDYCASPVLAISAPFEDGVSTYRPQSCQPMPRAGERCLIGPATGDAEWVPCHESTCRAVASQGAWICDGCDADTDCAAGQVCGADGVCADTP